MAQAAEFRAPDVGAGSAGAITRPLTEKLGLPQKYQLPYRWIPSQPADTETALIAGALDIGSFGAIGATQLNLRGVPIRLIAPSLNNHVRWIVRGDAPYQSVADLRGKAVATQPEATETYRTTWMTAALAGLDFKKEFRIHTGSPPAILALFERGDVEAVSITEPIATRLVARGYRELARIGDLWQQYTKSPVPMLLVGVAAKQDWVDKNPDLYRRYYQSNLEVREQIRRNPDILKDFATEFGIPPSEQKAIDLLPARLGPAFVSDWGRQEFASIDHQVDIALELGILQKRAGVPLYLSAPV